MRTFERTLTLRRCASLFLSVREGRVRTGALALVLVACQQHSAQPTTRPPPAAALIPCGTGAAPLARTCGVELTDGIVTVRNPDGGFHRLRLAPGRGLIAADGAAPARVTPVDADTIEVAIGDDRYRLPATVKRR